MKDQRGVVYLETLVAFLPVFLFFLATLQIADLSAAHIIVRHAATVAARAAVVVMPDDGRYYNDESNEQLHAFDGLRRQDIELAADRILRANPRLDNAPSNVVVGFQNPPVPPAPSPSRFACSAGSGSAPCLSRDEVLAAAFSSQTAGELLDTSTKGEGDWGMREKLDALVTAKYRCMLSFFCPREFTLVATASLLYQGARYTYEAWPDSIRSDGRPGSTPAAPVGPPSQLPGGPTGSTTNPGPNGPLASVATGSSSTTPNNQTGNASTPGPVASNAPGSSSSGPTASTPPGSTPSGPIASDTAPTSPSASTSRGPVASNTAPTSPSASNPNRPASNPGDGSGPTSNGSRTPTRGTRPSIVASAPDDSDTPTIAPPNSSHAPGNSLIPGNSPAADSSNGEHPNQTGAHAANTPATPGAAPRGNTQTGANTASNDRASASNPARGPAPTRGPPGRDTRGVISGAITSDERSSPTIPGREGNNAHAPDSTASIVANGPDADGARATANAADRGTRAPRNLAELRAQLPSGMREVPFVRDPGLHGNAVRVHYTYDARGRVTSVEIRVGPNAQARHIADHVNTVRTLQGYQGLSGRVRLVLDKLNAWIAGHPNVRPGSLAWETRREVEKLRAIVDARMRALDGAELSEAQRTELENERREYARQLAQHEANLEVISNEPGRGYIAAEDAERPLDPGGFGRWVYDRDTPRRRRLTPEELQELSDLEGSPLENAQQLERLVELRSLPKRARKLTGTPEHMLRRWRQHQAENESADFASWRADYTREQQEVRRAFDLAAAVRRHPSSHPLEPLAGDLASSKDKGTVAVVLTDGGLVSSTNSSAAGPIGQGANAAENSGHDNVAEAGEVHSSGRERRFIRGREILAKFAADRDRDQDAAVYHAEAQAVLRAFELGMINAGDEVRLVSDRATCSNKCQPSLHRLVEALGLNKLTIIQLNGDVLVCTAQGCSYP